MIYLINRQISFCKRSRDKKSCTKSSKMATGSQAKLSVTKHRKASLSEHERVFLHALLVDDGFAQHFPDTAKIDDNILFSVPAPLLGEPAIDSSSGEIPQRNLREHPRSGVACALHVGLWRAHEDGVRPENLLRVSQKLRQDSLGVIPKSVFHDETDEHIGEIIDTSISSENAKPTNLGESPIPLYSITPPPKLNQKEEHEEQHFQPETKAANPLEESVSVNKALEEASSKAIMSHKDEADTIKSDEEVRQRKCHADDKSDDSSWAEQEGGFQHYDAWQVLKDEYAQDFGFVYRNGNDQLVMGENGGIFKILGTSAEDVSSQPHVMSPPLLESLMNFVPEHLSNTNMWLKYSLVRDGASLITLRDLCKKSQYTFLAVETNTGSFVFYSHDSLLVK